MFDVVVVDKRNVDEIIKSIRAVDSRRMRLLTKKPTQTDWMGVTPEEWGVRHFLDYLRHRWESYFGVSCPYFKWRGREVESGGKEIGIISNCLIKRFTIQFKLKKKDVKDYIDWIFENYLPSVDNKVAVNSSLVVKEFLMSKYLIWRRGNISDNGGEVLSHPYEKCGKNKHAKLPERKVWQLFKKNDKVCRLCEHYEDCADKSWRKR